MIQKSYVNTNSLYLIPTPIGNLEDITMRSLNLLKEVDFILCEDTRVTGQLLKNYNISKKLVSCHEYNEEKIKKYVIDELKNNKSIGLVTDQGTPIISDPGYVVAKYVIEQGYNVIGLPGANAFVPALIMSGLDPSHFLYYGFLNSKNSKQKKELEMLKNYPFTMIFYEAPHRIENTLQNMYDIFGDRKISLSREISKIHEEVFRGKISEVMSELKVKGEFVIVVDGCNKQVDYRDLDVIEHIKLYLDDGLSEMEAIKIVAKERNVAKSVIYKEYIDKGKSR